METLQQKLRDLSVDPMNLDTTNFAASFESLPKISHPKETSSTEPFTIARKLIRDAKAALHNKYSIYSWSARESVKWSQTDATNIRKHIDIFGDRAKVVFTVRQIGHEFVFNVSFENHTPSMEHPIGRTSSFNDFSISQQFVECFEIAFVRK